MAAPDRVYRYFTNLKAKNHTQNGDDIFYVRCAKPLSSYVTPNLSPSAQLEELKTKFRIDGILWIKNPDVPHTASDPDITVDIEIEDPENPGQTITIQIDDPDLGDPDRSGFIAYVYPSGANAAFHDIRGYNGTPISNNGGGNNNYGSTDYRNRSWSRASKFRYKDFDDTEAAVILNDAGLNRRGEATVTAVDCSVDLTNGNLLFCGSLIAPPYNRINSWGIYYKWQSFSQPNSTVKDLEKATNPELMEDGRRITINSVVPRNATYIATVGSEFEIPLAPEDMAPDVSTNIKAKDWIFFRPFVVTEEGEYSYPFNENWYARVGAVKWKVKQSEVNTTLQAFLNSLDADASSDHPFTKAIADAIPDDNEENEEGLTGTMYLERKLPDSDSGYIVAVYNSASLSSESYYFGPPTASSTDPVYYFGGLYLNEENEIKYYKWGVLNYGTVGNVQGVKYINQTNVYAPKIKIMDMTTLAYKRSAIDNTLEYLIIDYYDTTLQTLMDGTTETHGYVAPEGKTWVNPNGSNDTQVVACIEEFNANFLSAIDDEGNHNHADKTDIFAEEGVSAWGCASINGMVSDVGTQDAIYRDIYKNINQAENMDGVSAATIRTERRYIYEKPLASHLFTGATVSFKMVENPTTNVLEAKGYVINIYVLGKYKDTYGNPDNSNGYQFVSDYTEHL